MEKSNWLAERIERRISGGTAFSNVEIYNLKKELHELRKENRAVEKDIRAKIELIELDELSKKINIKKEDVRCTQEEQKDGLEELNQRRVM